MRERGQGYLGLEKLTSLTKLPKPMTANDHDKMANQLNIVVREIIFRKYSLHI